MVTERNQLSAQGADRLSMPIRRDGLTIDFAECRRGEPSQVELLPRGLPQPAFAVD
jgi:hypothetical protein